MRADANQAQIVKKLRDMGATVVILSQVGGGCPDLLCGFQGRNYVFEVKTPQAARKKNPFGKSVLSDRQVKWFLLWKGHANIIRSFEEAVSIFNNA